MTKERKALMTYGLAGLGNVAGLIIAVKRKSGFWGGLGWFLLGGMAGGALGYVATSLIKDDAVKPQDSLSARFQVNESGTIVEVNSPS